MLEAVRLGGSLIRAGTGQESRISFKTSWADLVTEVDQEIERQIRRLIQRRFPDHGLVGEEEGGGWDRPFTWLLDPLDGTTNFAHGLQASVCSLACYRGQEPLVGAVYDPFREELFAARAGGGATRNGAAIRVDPTPHLQESLIGTNLIWDTREGRFHRLPGLQHLGAHVRGIRSLGAAALELAYVACGRFTGFVQIGLGPWDYAAGQLLVREAGGQVTRLDGSATEITQPGDILASNGRIHAQALALLQERRLPAEG